MHNNYFLDLPREIQSKVVNYLTDKEVYKLGSTSKTMLCLINEWHEANQNAQKTLIATVKSGNPLTVEHKRLKFDQIINAKDTDNISVIRWAIKLNNLDFLKYALLLASKEAKNFLHYSIAIIDAAITQLLPLGTIQQIFELIASLCDEIETQSIANIAINTAKAQNHAEVHTYFLSKVSQNPIDESDNTPLFNKVY